MILHQEKYFKILDLFTQLMQNLSLLLPAPLNFEIYRLIYAMYQFG